jgi:hypothetical protein
VPANKGRKPPHELVDIKLRCGWVVRDVESRLYRWKPWPEGESGGDILSWQPAGTLKKWQGQHNDAKAG